MKKLLKWLSSDVHGSNRLSHEIRSRIERLHFRQFVGVNLAGLAFAVAIVAPQTSAAVSAWEVSHDPPMVTIPYGPEESETRWPLTTFGISQNFRVGHPGMDLTAPLGTPVYPVADGTVAWTSFLSYGYGNHVFITSNNQLQSLYGHLSKILVRPGETVTKKTEIGLVGATGWATGNHVHLEVYQNGVAINPDEVLPEIKQ